MVELVKLQLEDLGAAANGVSLVFIPRALFPTGGIEGAMAAHRASVSVNKAEGGCVSMGQTYKYAGGAVEFQAEYHISRYPPDKSAVHVLELRLK